MAALKHSTVYEDESLIAKKLSFGEELRAHHKDGTFPLVRDPVATREALMIGMFVLRPAANKPFTENILDDDGKPTSLFNQSLDWAFNIAGLDGGWIVANGSPVDAYRLGMQYGLSDAVMMGTGTLVSEGVSTDVKHGYVWQPYGPLSWPHVIQHDPHALEKVAKQRKEWIAAGYLSSREYPAQIVISLSGKSSGPTDFLAAAVFHDLHPNGQPLEAFIVTSEIGAQEIRSRSHLFGLSDRVESMLIILPSVDGGSPTDVDFSYLPRLLFEKYDIRIVNHDGGQIVLKDFSKWGILHQMNITLARKQTLLEVVRGRKDLSPETIASVESDFSNRVSYFFDRRNSDPDSHGVPPALRVANVIVDDKDDVAVVTFVPPSSRDWWP